MNAPYISPVYYLGRPRFHADCAILGLRGGEGQRGPEGPEEGGTALGMPRTVLDGNAAEYVFGHKDP